MLEESAHVGISLKDTQSLVSNFNSKAIFTPALGCLGAMMKQTELHAPSINHYS